MERGNEWSVRVAKSIGQRVAHYRNRADLTGVMLSARCADLGLPLDRNVIAKLENGHRNSVTVDEVCVLAAALGIPPLLLLFGAGTEEAAEVLPGKYAPAFRAALWFSGEGPLPEPGQGPDQGWVVMPLTWYRDHDRRVIEEVNALTMAGVAAVAAETASPADREALLAAADRQLDIARGHHDAGRILREQIALAGYLPPVPGELNHARETPGREPAATDE